MNSFVRICDLISYNDMLNEKCIWYFHRITDRREVDG